eukprot:s138_g22.t1
MASKELTEEGADKLLAQLDTAYRRVEESQGSRVKLESAEINLLKVLEQARDMLTAALMASADRAALKEIFGGSCRRTGRIRAVLDAAQFTSERVVDPRLMGCRNACESVEQVLRDLGLGAALRAAQVAEREALAKEKAMIASTRTPPKPPPGGEDAAAAGAAAAAAKAAEEADRLAREEAARKAAEAEESARAAAVEAAEREAKEEAARTAAAEAARRAAEEEAARKAAAEEAAAAEVARVAEEEEAARKAAEAEAARKVAEEEAARRLAEEAAAAEAARRGEEEEAARRAAAEDAARKAAEEAARRDAEARAAEMAARKASEEEARKRREEEVYPKGKGGKGKGKAKGKHPGAEVCTPARPLCHAEKVPLCKIGCGRQVAPGVTRHGKPFDTCCRGCALGAGHDDLCGKIHPSKEGTGTELGIYLAWVKRELDEESACLELPFTLLLLISFSVFALLHLKQHDTFAVPHVMSVCQELVQNANFAWAQNFGHKSVYDVNSYADFWSWFRIGFLPLAVQHTWAFSEGLNETHPGDSTTYTLPFGPEPDEAWAQATLPVPDQFSTFNRIVAGIRLRQERSAASWDSCKLPDTVSPDLMRAWLGKPCMPADPPYELTPEAHHAESFREPSQRTELLGSLELCRELQLSSLDMEDGCSQLDAKWGALRTTARKSVLNLPAALVHTRNTTAEYTSCACKSCAEGARAADGQTRPGPWLDEYTQRVELGMVAYNQNHGLISLVSVNFFFNRRLAVVVAADASRPNRLQVVTRWVVWVGSLLFIFISEVRELLGAVRSAKYGIYQAIFGDYLNFWNMVDWISIICAYAVIGTYLRLIAQENLTYAESEAWSVQVFDAVETMVLAEADFRFTLSFYPIVVMLRLLKSFDAQPRLSVVTRTLYTATVDILHFFIVISCVYLCLALNALMVFGQDMQEDLDARASSADLVPMQDWPSMEKVGAGRLIASMWMWTFQIIVVVLLVNMLLAIILDAYSEVKSRMSLMTTLDAQISEMLRRRRQSLNKERVRLSEVWNAYLEKYGDEKLMLSSREIITPEDVMERVQGIPKSQAKRTLANARQTWEQSLESPYTPDSYMEHLKLCGVRLDLLRHKTSHIRSVMSAVAGRIGLTENPTIALQETTSKAVSMVKESFGRMAFSGYYRNVKVMSKQVDEVLREECNALEDRQEDVCSQQKEFTEVSKETKSRLLDLHQDLQKVAMSLQEIAASREIKEQRQFGPGMRIQVGPGKCKMGCGLDAAKGRGCATGEGHDGKCGKDVGDRDVPRPNCSAGTVVPAGRGGSLAAGFTTRPEKPPSGAVLVSTHGGSGHPPSNKQQRVANQDEHGDGEVAADATAEEPQQDPDCAANWWACSEPPAHLRDVPEGFLLTSDWDLGARTDKPFTTVCDPDHCYFSGLGAERVWAAGLALARHLWQWSWSGSPSVVELGAGCGLPGMVLARRGARVTLTDVPWLLQLMEYNIEANFLEDDPSRPSVASLRWGSREDLRELQKDLLGRDVGVPDLVVGADLVYREQDFDALLSTIASLKPRHALLAVRRRDRILEDSEGLTGVYALPDANALGRLQSHDCPACLLAGAHTAVDISRSPAHLHTAGSVSPWRHWKGLSGRSCSMSRGPQGREAKAMDAEEPGARQFVQIWYTTIDPGESFYRMAKLQLPVVQYNQLVQEIRELNRKSQSGPQMKLGC